MAGSEAINAETNVEEIVTRFPETARVFVRWRMNCVGCEVSRFETLADACRIYDRPLEDVLAELRSTVEPESRTPLQ